MKIRRCLIAMSVLLYFTESVLSTSQELPTNKAVEQTMGQQARCDPNSQVDTNLSGDYIGRIDVPGSKTSKARLQIDGRAFKLTTEEGLTLTGELSAVTTCDYTAAAFRVTEAIDAAHGGSEPTVLNGTTFSVKARIGKRISLKNVSGEDFSFLFQCDCNKCNNPKKCDCCGG